METKIICRPRECVNAGCVASCCIAVYEDNKVFFKDNPKNCPDFKKEVKMSKLPEERHAMGYKGETKQMMENEIVVDDEACYVYLSEGDNVFVKRTIITKEAFIKCYKKWVEGDTDGE